MEVAGRKDKNVEGELLCQPCQTDGEKKSAEGYCETCNEYFCSACLKFHRKQSATRNHAIKSKDEMPRIKVLSDPCSELCALHKTEIVKYFCQNHNMVGCGDCMIVGHKACKVDLVYDVSANYSYSKELRQIKQKTELLVDGIRSRKSDVECNLKDAAEIHRRAVEDIRNFRKDINTYLDKAEEKLLKEAEHLLSTDVSVQSNLRDKCESMEREMDWFQKQLETNSENINTLFVTAKLAQKRLQECQHEAEQIASESKINSYKFEVSKNLMDLRTASSFLGFLSKKKTIDKKANFMKSLIVKTENEDENKTHITGLALISSDEILLADIGNKSLKILNIRENRITLRYSRQPSASPNDVTTVNAETAAATFPDEGEIYFMNTANGLSKIKSWTVGKGCSGIDHKGGIMAVFFGHHYPASVQILNMEGDVLKHVSDIRISDHCGSSRIAFSNDCRMLYISESNGDTVHEIKLYEKVNKTHTFQFSIEDHPRGLAVAIDGTIIVCCEGGGNSLNMIVPNSGEILPLILEHVESPISVLLCEEQNKIFVYGSSSGCGAIVMFKLK